jgi:membrane-associated phospholipid phosphatase
LNLVRRLLICACISLACASCSRAQSAKGDSVDRPVTRILLDDLDIAYRDATGFFTAPFSFDATDWNRVAVGTVAIGAVMAMDEPLNSLMVANPYPDFLAKPFEWGERWGNLRTMQYATLGVYFGGLVAGHDGIRVTGRLMGEALLLAGLPAITLQYGLGRSRPYAGKGAWDYNFFEWSNEFQSLPSGHATVAFAISTVLAKRIDRTWAGIPLYAMAGLTAFSLGWTNEHWPSDLLIGAALGYLAGSYVVEREEERSAVAGAEGAGERSRFGVGVGPGGVTVRYLIYR